MTFSQQYNQYKVSPLQDNIKFIFPPSKIEKNNYHYILNNGCYYAQYTQNWE